MRSFLEFNPYWHSLRGKSDHFMSLYILFLHPELRKHLLTAQKCLNMILLHFLALAHLVEIEVNQLLHLPFLQQLMGYCCFFCISIFCHTYGTFCRPTCRLAFWRISWSWISWSFSRVLLLFSS